MDADWDGTFMATFVKGLQTTRQQKLYSDITVTVDGTSYECHKLVLGSMSPYFNCMFTSGMQESRSGNVSLPFLDSTLFEELLDFFYGGKDIVTPDNAADLLKAASFMQIECLQERCEQSLVDTLTTDNCVPLWQLAKQHHCGNLVDMAWKMMLAKFSAVANVESFQSLDVNELVELLEADDLYEPNESLVCEAAMKWIQANIAQRRPFLVKVLGCLRLPLTSGEYLVSLCRRYPFLTVDSQAEPFLTAAREYHMTPARQQDLCSVNTEQRKCSTYTDCMFFVGTHGQVSCFSLSEKQWFRLASVPDNLFRHGPIALCTYGKSCVFLYSGAYLGYRDDTFKYNGNTNVWNRGPKLIHGRKYHEMVAVGDSIYVLGGFSGVSADPRRHVTSIENVPLKRVNLFILANC
jgi:hypothetical protein